MEPIISMISEMDALNSIPSAVDAWEQLHMIHLRIHMLILYVEAYLPINQHHGQLHVKGP